MQNNSKENLAILLFKELNKNNIFRYFEKCLQSSPTNSQIIEIIKFAQEFDNFILRYAKPILKKLIDNKFLVADLTNEYRDVLNIFGIEVEKKDLPKKREKDSPPNGYFRAWISANHFDYTPVIKDISENFKTENSDSRNLIFVSVDQINEFIEKYKSIKEIHWYIISQETNIHWTDDLITMHTDLWDWKYLNKNSSVFWHFNLLAKIPDKINWQRIIHEPQLKWDAEQINRFRNYLHFSNIGIRQDFGGSYVGYNYLTDKTNFKGASLSLSSCVDWNFDLINQFKDLWDWNELSTNENFIWDRILIDHFSDRISFDYLSINKNVEWTEDLIDDYIERWNWEWISGNPKLPWSSKFMKKYEMKWQWRPKYDWYFDEKTNTYPSISTNPGIIWDSTMFQHFKDRIDLWRIAKVASINDDVLRISYDELCRNEKVGLEFYKYSDWKETVDTYRTGWENLKRNNNFAISLDNIEFYFLKNIELTYPVGNMANDGTYVTKSYRLLDLLKEKPIYGITINDLIENEFGWTQYLLNENFINNSVWDQVIEPLFTEEQCLLFLTNLRLYCNNNTEQIMIQIKKDNL